MTPTSLSLRTTTKRLHTLRHFSTKPPPPPNPNPNSDPPKQQQPSFASYFSDVKSSLRSPPPPPNQRSGFGQQRQTERVSHDKILKNLSEFRARSAAPVDNGQSPPVSFRLKNLASHDKILKNLSEFRARSAAPVENGQSPPVSFRELYSRGLTPKHGDVADEAKKFSFDAIKASIKQLNPQKPRENPLSINKLKESFTLQPGDSGKDLFHRPMLSDLKDKKNENSATTKSEFVKMYSYKELGKKLRMLRPEGKPDGGFSLQELNDRLEKLREMEEKESESNHGILRDLRASLIHLKVKETKAPLHKLNFLSHMGTPTFMLHPPKEHLVEKYFHPDNMSSAEKLKIELQKVRDDFKMSESDCGSARVQVAQLTTKIKHLATALHKKDKHSRKGLQEMIQRRKKLLKYLRRTDWDSYTLVLSKLGLRDNPDYKN